MSAPLYVFKIGDKIIVLPLHGKVSFPPILTFLPILFYMHMSSKN